MAVNREKVHGSRNGYREYAGSFAGDRLGQFPAFGVFVRVGKTDPPQLVGADPEDAGEPSGRKTELLGTPGLCVYLGQSPAACRASQSRLAWPSAARQFGSQKKKSYP